MNSIPTYYILTRKMEYILGLHTIKYMLDFVDFAKSVFAKVCCYILNQAFNLILIFLKISFKLYFFHKNINWLKQNFLQSRHFNSLCSFAY